LIHITGPDTVRTVLKGMLEVPEGRRPLRQDNVLCCILVGKP
jgi:hypothetical protein